MAPLPHRPQPDSDLSDILARINQNFDQLDGEDRTKIIKNGATPVLLMGYQSGGFNGEDYGLKIAKPGFDVTTATNDELIFSSAFNTFKIVATGTTSVTVTSHGNVTHTATIAHGLSSIPAFIAFVSYGGTYLQLPTPVFLYNGGTGNYDMPAYFSGDTDATNLYLRMTVGNTAVFDGNSYSFRYYILQETAN